MRKIVFIFTLLFVFLPSLKAQALEDNQQKQRPKIGLVLSGGGAKGSAHIGVLKMLEEVGIPVDYIAGTSMGSIIGGLYSMGYTSSQMDSLIKNVDWTLYMSNTSLRRNVTYIDKENSARYILKVPFGQGVKEEERRVALKQSLPNGFLMGDNFLNLFNSFSIGYQEEMDFNDLPIPYACVAVDLVTGDEVVIRQGKLPAAMRASMSIPGVFAPVYDGDRVLIDGGFRNNFPVDVCKEMGADIVIGSRVSYSYDKDKDELRALPPILGNLMTVVTEGESLKHIKECDIFIAPDISGFGALSFTDEAIDTLTARGYKAADLQKEELKKLKAYLDSFGVPVEQEYKAPAARSVENELVNIVEITMTGVDEEEREWLIRKADILQKEQLTGAEISEAVSVMNGTGQFSSIRYNLYEVPGTENGYRLAFDFSKAHPHVIGIGVRFDSQEAAEILAKFAWNENKLTGFKFNIEPKLSYNPSIKAAVSYGARYLPKVTLSYKFSKESISSSYDTFMEGSQDRNRYFRNQARLTLSQLYTRSWAFEGGLEYNKYKFFYLNYSTLSETYKTFDNFGLYARIGFDNLDRKYFATRGIDFDLSGGWKFKSLINSEAFLQGTEDDYGDIRFAFKSYISTFNGKFVIIPQVYARQTLGKYTPVYNDNLNYIGGAEEGRHFDQQLPFIGLNGVQTLVDESVAVLRSDFRLQVADKHYLTAMVNYARISNTLEDFFKPVYYDEYIDENGDTVILSQSASNLVGAGLRYSYSSLLGPFSIDFHWSNLSKRLGVYASLGYYF